MFHTALISLQDPNSLLKSERYWRLFDSEGLSFSDRHSTIIIEEEGVPSQEAVGDGLVERWRRREPLYPTTSGPSGKLFLERRRYSHSHCPTSHPADTALASTSLN
jgi:hypothetical protein